MHSLMFVWSVDIDLEFFQRFVSMLGTFRLIFGLIRCAGVKAPLISESQGGSGTYLTLVRFERFIAGKAVYITNRRNSSG